jgi:protocatechuate 3,4-dioxygenase beta subunit
VPYASVAVFDPKRRFDGEETALTDLEGRYRVGGLRPGRLYEIRVAAAGYAPVLDESAAHVQVTPGVREVVKDFVLEGGAALTGTVRDPDGAPVSGARIALIAEGGRREQSSVADLAAVTNAVGAWRLEGVPPGLGLQVEARHDLWARAVSERLVLEPDQEHAVDLVLGVGLKLEGRVTDERGRPVAEARVRWGVVPPGEENRLGDEFRADQLLVQRVVRTTEEGAFVVDRLEPARYLLKVEKEGYADWYRKDLVIGGDGAVPFQPVELLGASSITGRVRAAASGTPIVDAWVYAEERKPGAEETADPGRVRAVVSAQTGRDGRYALEGLPPGRYNVVVWLAVGYQAAAQNWRDPTSRREDVASGTANVDFELVP